MTAATFDLGKLHGGLRLDANKSQATGQDIVDIPIPTQLVIPLKQHVGEESQPVVAIGERVLRGQLIAECVGELGAPVHASSSGTLVSIEPWPVTRRYGDKALCMIIETDGLDEEIRHETYPDYDTLVPSELLERIVSGGIVGLGGAVFPTAQKLMQADTCDMDMLILNAVECEPYISCDDMLMRDRAAEVISGAQILLHALGIDECLIGIESDKPEAIDALLNVLAESGDERITIKQVPTIYPSGGEDQLVQLIANREVPSGGLPTDIGCLVQNVGTAAAVHDWIVDGRPLTSRVTTITGNGVGTPMNVRARLGTPVAELAPHAGGYTDHAELLIIGGPMTGKSVSTDDVPVVKATNCVLVMSELPAAGKELPCIRCGECAAACPVQLMPQQLFWYACADDETRLREFGLTDCIECGCCDLVCPSHIPLTFDFRMAKARIREQADEKARAERARRRFEARNERLAHDRDTRDEAQNEQRAEAKKASRNAIAEILARKRDKDTKP
ncbi:MAG: electron transport complex subunit RsxC [Pseudomonadota bacterium]